MDNKIFKGIYNQILRPRRLKWNASQINKLEGETILDIGCFDAKIKEHLNPKFKYYGLDCEPRNSNIIKGDIESVNIKKKFDIVICTETLEHLKDPIATIRKLKTITNKYLVVSVPHEPQYTFSRFGIWQAEHYWTLTPEILKLHLGIPYKETLYNLGRHYFAIWKFD